MSYWFPKLHKESLSSVLQLPETKIIPLTEECWNWLRSDRNTEEAVHSTYFNDYFLRSTTNSIQ